MPVINRSLRLVKGENCYVWDDSGKKYLDCVAGVAVCNTGHCHPKVVKAICRQAGELIHSSNLYFPPNQETFARRLVEISGINNGSVFMCNSGAEANEAALKLSKLRTDRNEYIAFVNAFHGRIATPLSVTYKPSIREPFEPFGPKRSFVEYGDKEALSETITHKTAAVIVEGIQGEAGIIPAPKGFYREVREICDDYGALMIADEIQTGFGRTGEWFYYQHTGITPDIVSMAKGIASGFPMGAIVAREGLSFGRGEHGSTFAGGPLACAAGLATVDVLRELIPHVKRKGERFIGNLSGRNPRGLGLMIGLDAGDSCDEIRETCLDGGLLVNCTGKETLRLLPPLTIENDEIDFASGVINEAFDKAGL